MVVFPRSQWGTVLVCFYLGFPGTVPCQIQILEARFVVTFIDDVIVEVCDSTSFLCFKSVLWAFWWVPVFENLWVLLLLVSGGCCQTTSRIGESFGLVYSGLLVAALEWRRGNSSLIFELQLEHLRLNGFGVSLNWTWFCLSALRFRGGGVLAALAQ